MRNIYLIEGKSGTGKSTIVSKLCERYGYKELLSYTERPKRGKDEEGTHIFLNREEFDKLTDFVGYTVFNGYRYGATKEQAENSDIYIIDPDGIKFFKENYNGNKGVVVVYIVCCKVDEVDRNLRSYRMSNRNSDREEIIERIENDDKRFEYAEELCDYVIENIDVEKSVDELNKIIQEKEAI